MSPDPTRGVVQLGPFPPPYGGVAANLLSIDKLMVARGVPCAIVSVAGPRQENRDRIYFPVGARGLLATLRRLPHRILHIHVGGDLSRRVLGMVLACTLLRGRRTVLTLHSGGAAAAADRAGRSSLVGLAFRRVDRLIGVNAEMIEWFGELGCEPERVRLVQPHAIDADYLTEAAKPLEGDLGSFRARHTPMLATVGGLEPEYDVATQLSAVQLLTETHADTGLVVVGAGGLESELAERARDLGVSSRVHFAGALTREDTARVIASADVLLRTTLYDGDSIAVREALHLRTPVVATDNGMRPEGVRLVPVGAPEAVAEAVTELLGADRVGEPAEPETANIEAVLDVYAELGVDAASRPRTRAEPASSKGGE